MIQAKLLFLFTALGLCLMCQPRDDKIDTKILEVFSDFSFVGSGTAVLGADGSVDARHVSEHDESEQAKPQKLELRVQYIFHHRESVDNEVLALQTLPKMLSEKGFRIIEAPKSSEYLLHPIYGGPLFQIKFSHGNHVGIIYNSLHMGLKDGWTEHDYVLVYIQ